MSRSVTPRNRMRMTAVKQEVVHRDGAGEAGEIGEGGVGGEREDQQDRRDGRVIEPAASHDRAEQHGEDALVIRTVGIGCADTIGTAKE
jgi:high-affinity K+ transport system ATPase subunit B